MAVQTSPLHILNYDPKFQRELRLSCMDIISDLFVGIRSIIEADVFVTLVGSFTS